MRYCGFDDFMTSDDKGLLIARFTILSYYPSITPAIKEVLEKTGNWLRHPEFDRERLERLQDFIRDPDPVPTSVPIQAVVEATDAPESPVRLSRQSKVVA